MCGRYGYSKRALEKIASKLNVGTDEAMGALMDRLRQNHAPTMPGPVVRPGRGRLEMLRWGFMSAASPGRPPHLLINARSETVSTLPSFREAWRHRRCLVPADYFYEWDQTAPKGATRQPYRFARADGEPLMMAGLWSPLPLADGRQLDAYALLTTEAAPTVAQFHHRMPVILPEEDWPTWMDERNPAPVLTALQKPYAGPMTAVPVDTALNKAAYQGVVDEVTVQPKQPQQGELFG